MWGFETQVDAASEPEDLAHWPTERMIAEGHAEYATEDDLKDLDDETLTGIANVCEVSEFRPEECIPCLAHIMILDRRKEAYAEQARAALGPVGPQPFPPEFTLEPDFPVLEEDAPFPDQIEQVPVVERFAGKVADLQNLVNELLNGPPIPPPDVTLEELGALVVGAKKWVAMIDAQGIELAPQQQAVKEEIERVITKVYRG